MESVTFEKLITKAEDQPKKCKNWQFQTGWQCKNWQCKNCRCVLMVFMAFIDFFELVFYKCGAVSDKRYEYNYRECYQLLGNE